MQENILRELIVARIHAGPVFVRVGFWQNGFFADFLFLSRRIFSRILSPDFFSSFLWRKCPEKSSKKIPGKILQHLYNKNPRHISAEGPGQYFLHHPSGVGMDGVVKFFRLIYFSGMCCRKFVLRNVTLGPLLQKRNQARQWKRNSMKWLSLVCLIIASKYWTVIVFSFFAFRLCPHSKRVINARVQEDGCFSSPTTRNVRQSAVQSNRLFYF